MMFNVLKDYHVMLGVPWLEKHDAVFPPGVPAKMIPHTCGAILCMGIWGVLTGLPNGDVITSGYGRTLSRGSDIGPLIPHINIPPAPPNMLLPVILLSSGSKSHFGAHKHVAAQGPVAFACLCVVNLNLNCAGPTMPPLPSGVVIAFNTNVTGVTIGDLVSGVLSLVLDSAIQFGLNRLFASPLAQKIFGAISSKIAGALLARMGEGGLLRIVGVKAVGELLQALGYPAAGQLAENALGVIIPDLLGSPLGYALGGGLAGPLGGSSNYGKQQDKVADAVDDYFNSPGPADVPTSSPGSSPPPGSGGGPPPGSGGAPPPGSGGAPPPGSGGAPPPGSGGAPPPGSGGAPPPGSGGAPPEGPGDFPPPSKDPPV